MADDEQVQVTGTEARGGETTHVTRYVLGISLTLVVLIFAAILVYYRYY